mgnify:CR=1 FL=1
MKIDKYFFSATCLMAVLLLTFAACTQDELAEQAGILPEGKYPLQIGSVSITADVDAQPWSVGAPQTRVRENDDRNSSRWDWWGREVIGVQIEGSKSSGLYLLTFLYTVSANIPVYWEDTQAHKVRAWYPADGNVALDKQTTDNGLAYALYAKTAEAVDYKAGKIPLSFDHKLAKVRVKLEGEKAADAKSVEIKTYTSCTLNADGTLTAGGTEDFIPMVETTYNGAKCWEANVMPGHIIKEFRLNGNKGTLSDDGFSPVAGMISTINIKVSKSPIPEDAQEITGEISDNGNYLVKGNYTKRITITGGSPHIYLKDANINVEDVRNDNAIHITGGSPTIHVLGENNVSVPYGAGIFVAEGYTVTIVGYKREDKLTARGGGSEGGSGIGASFSANAGNIHISNVTVEAHGSDEAGERGGVSAGIGGSKGYSCGTITIEDATVHAYGIQRNNVITPGIGSGYPYDGNPPSIPVVTISNSEIHTHRSSNGYGSNADYIGWGRDDLYPNNTPANSTINLNGGTCTGSTVYCYTGDTLDKTVAYDASGNGTEQSQ